MTLDEVPSFGISERSRARITLQSSQNQVIHLFILEQDIIRVLVLPDGQFRFPKTWAIAPGLEDVPLAGRDRLDLEQFTLPAFELTETPEQLQVTTDRIRLTVRLKGFHCRWEVKQGGHLAELQDRDNRSARAWPDEDRRGASGESRRRERIDAWRARIKESEARP